MHVDIFVKVTMKEGVVDIELMKMQPMCHGKSKKGTNNDHLGNESKGLYEVKAFLLIITFSHQPGFISLD
jgi:hypothetical protein